MTFLTTFILLSSIINLNAFQSRNNISILDRGISMNFLDRAKDFLGGIFPMPESLPPYKAPFQASDEVWKAKLTREQYYILRQEGTERPWTSTLNDEKRSGVFECAGCGSELFPSTSKYNSGTGWPSFSSPSSSTSIVERTDYSLMIERTEVICSNCGGHLGHVFRDGPRPTGLRYCINGVALKFSPAVKEVETDDELVKWAEKKKTK